MERRAGPHARGSRRLADRAAVGVVIRYLITRPERPTEVVLEARTLEAITDAVLAQPDPASLYVQVSDGRSNRGMNEREHGRLRQPPALLLEQACRRLATHGRRSPDPARDHGLNRRAISQRSARQVRGMRRLSGRFGFCSGRRLGPCRAG